MNCSRQSKLRTKSSPSIMSISFPELHRFPGLVSGEEKITVVNRQSGQIRHTAIRQHAEQARQDPNPVGHHVVAPCSYTAVAASVQSIGPAGSIPTEKATGHYCSKCRMNHGCRYRRKRLAVILDSSPSLRSESKQRSAFPATDPAIHPARSDSSTSVTIGQPFIRHQGQHHVLVDGALLTDDSSGWRAACGIPSSP